MNDTLPNNRTLFRALLIGLVGGLSMMTCAILCAGAWALTLREPPQRVTLIVGGVGQQIETQAQTVGDLLAENHQAMNSSDLVYPPLESTLSPGAVVRLERARAVTLVVDDVAQTVFTRFTNPLDILRSAGIELGSKDQIMLDGTLTTAEDLLLWPVPVSSITIQRALTVTIQDGAQALTIETTAATIGEALYEAGVTLYLADAVTPDVNTPITADLQVNIERSQPITIIADDVTLETRTQGNLVNEALASAGVALMGLDYSIPDENSSVQPGMTIRVIRVTEQVEVEQTTIPFEVVWQADAELELDQRRVMQEGQNGISQANVRIRYENGVEVSRQPEAPVVAAAPVNRVIGYGTKIVLRTIDTPDGPREYWRVVRMYITSYHPAALGGDNITATGRVLTKGIVGVDPKLIPYGSQIYVDGYGVGLAADTGGPRRIKLWVDLGYDDANFVGWSKWQNVYWLTPIPPNIVYVLPE